MLFWRAPDMPIRPEGEGSQFLDSRVGGFNRIADGEGRGVEYADIASETVEDS